MLSFKTIFKEYANTIMMLQKNLLSKKLVLTKEKLLIFYKPQTGYTLKHFYRTNYKFNNFDRGYFYFPKLCLNHYKPEREGRR